METTFTPVIAASATVDERSAFIARTYVHLAGAVLAFAGIEAALLASPLRDAMLNFLGQGRFAWLVILVGFMLVGRLAERWAQSSVSEGLQYLGLAVYVVAEAVIFLPILALAALAGPPGVIPTAGLTTGFIFIGLTGVVFATRKDFSFLRGILGLGGLAAIGLIVAGALFGFELGIVFSVAMVALAGGYVLYYTSQILHRYRTDQHVAASLALFAAVALLFWYVLRIFLSRRR